MSQETAVNEVNGKKMLQDMNFLIFKVNFGSYWFFCNCILI